MKEKNSDYEIYKKNLEQATNEINQRSALQTTRKGLRSFRDKFAFYKIAIFFAYGYIQIIQTIIIMLGVTPDAIENINMFFRKTGIPFQLPVDISSILAVIIIFSLFTFGVFAMLVFGLYKREQEIGCLQHPGLYLISKQDEEISNQTEEILKQNKIIIKLLEEKK